MVEQCCTWAPKFMHIVEETLDFGPAAAVPVRQHFQKEEINVWEQKGVSAALPELPP